MKKLPAILTGLVIASSSLLAFTSANGASISADIVTWGYNNGITKYDSVTEFNADATVTREQAAKMIVTWIQGKHQLGLSMPAEVNCTFNDAASIDSSLSYGVESACAYGLFKGYKGDFMPKRDLLRQDARTLLVRALDQLPSYESHRNKVPGIKAGFMTRGELLKALYQINVVVEAQIEDEKEADLVTAQANLDAAMALWNSKNVTGYTVRQQLSCFCTPNSTHPISFEVKNNVVVSGSIQDVNETDKIPANELTVTPKTIPQAFALIQDAIDRDADSITITYDATFGYPKQINVDYSVMMADEEMYYTFEVSNVNK